MAVGWTMAAIGMASAVIDNRYENSQMMKQAREYGRQSAAVEANKYRAQANVAGQVAMAHEMADQEKLRIESNRAATQSQATLNAAAAGVEGNSVDVLQTEAQASADRELGAVDTNLQSAINQAEQTLRDINIGADAAQSELEINTQRGQLANVFSQGLRGFLFGRNL